MLFYVDEMDIINIKRWDREYMQNDKRPLLPAKLPARSRAAAAQKLNDRPLPAMRGAYYPVPHLQKNPKGWRTKRHLKRKQLRRSNEQVAAIDRLGTRWSMLPLALAALIVVVVLASLLVTISAAVEATQERYQQQVVTLADILPKDSLKMYEKHGTLIYSMVDQ